MKFYIKNAIKLISALALSQKKDPRVVRYTPQKTRRAIPERRTLPIVSPEKVGVSSKTVADMLRALEAEKRANVHSITVVKDGRIIAECSRPGYSVRLMHLSHSMSKTVIGMLIGILWDEGLIKTEDTMAILFPEYDINPSVADVSVKDLLIMSSGVPFSEIGTVTDTRWTETFLGSDTSFVHGEKFAYNSMNSYMLAVIAHRILNEHYGVGISDFLKERLFSPLHVTEFFWEKGPEEIEKGGWGLYLSAESWAKLGILMMNGGVYDGVRILSEKWVRLATSTHSITPSETGDFNYGYQIWVSRDSEHFLFNGMLGQNVLVIPENKIVVALNSENNELFSESPALSIIRSHLGGELDTPKTSHASELKRVCNDFFKTRLCILPRARKRGIAELFGLRKSEPFDHGFDPLLKKFTVAENNVGILPLFIRAMQNNFQGGIESLEFRRVKDSLFMISTEGGREYAYRLGIYGYETSALDYSAESYIVRALASVDTSETGERIWRIEILYPEMPNSRRMELSLNENASLLTVRMSENPNESIADSFISSLYAMGAKTSFFIDMLESRLGKNFIERRIAELFSLTLTAVAEDCDGSAALLAEENRKVSERIASLSLVRGLVSKLLGDEAEPPEDKLPSLGGMIFSTLIDRIKNRNGGGEDK